MTRRIGIIGMGFVGRYVYDQILARPELGLDIAFVHNRTPEKLVGIAADHVLDDLNQFEDCQADLIVELAHPAISQVYGAAFLSKTDYMILSVTAMADAATEASMLAACAAHGTRLYIPHGALVGVDSLYEGRDKWQDVTITFRKNPKSIDFSESGLDPATITGETTLYDGPVRGLALKYPRNVNTMVTCALATIGLDRCRAVFIADPAYDFVAAEVIASGLNGSFVKTEIRESAVGVSGPSLLEAQIMSILRTGEQRPGLVFV